MVDQKSIVRFLLCIGLVQVACYYLAGMISSIAGGMSLAQPDTLLYCQAARLITEGSPFSFSQGSLPCSGTTSILYPFLLSIPYALGCNGGGILLAGFVLNASFYLTFLWGWGNVMCCWLERGSTRLLATVLLALAGHPAYCSFAQSDIGCWLALSSLLAMGLATNCRWLYGTILVVAPWFRPEGMICGLAFALIASFTVVYGLKTGVGTPVREAYKDFGWAVLAIISSIGVFVFNYYLTGHWQFSSVAGKGYFSQLPLSDAVYHTVGDVLTIFRELFLGLADSLPRELTLVPLLGGVSVTIGIFLFPWGKRSSRWLPLLLLSSLGGILTVANSRFQGTNYDRYLVWIMPLMYLFAAAGVEVISDKLPARINRWALHSVFIMFAVMGAITSVFTFSKSTSACERFRLFARECESIIPKGASVGTSGYAGLVYELSPRRCAHLPGIYSPEFQTRLGISGIVEILQNEPETRFDYWLDRLEDYQCFMGSGEDAARMIVRTGVDGFVLAKSDWSLYDGCSFPRNVPEGLKLVDRVDVAYERDEERCQYEIIDRYGSNGFLPFHRIDNHGETQIVESGRVIVGGDAMTVSLHTNKAVTVVMRTCPRQSAAMASSGRVDEFSFANPLSFYVDVDGRRVDLYTLEYSTNGFSDVCFKIPAMFVTGPKTRLSFLGDHIACCYWFYQ